MSVILRRSRAGGVRCTVPAGRGCRILAFWRLRTLRAGGNLKPGAGRGRRAGRIEENAMGSPVTGFRSTPLGRFLCAPFELRSYANLLYLALAFPLGLAYFVFLVVGLSVGLGTVIIWVGVPILAAVLAGSFAFSMFERELAIRLLGAEVPPMTPATGGPQSVSQRIKAFLKNPVTWKGLGYLAVKFPLGLG